MKKIAYEFDNFKVMGKTENEVLRNALMHMKKRHPEMMRGILDEMSEGDFMEALKPDIEEI